MTGRACEYCGGAIVGRRRSVRHCSDQCQLWARSGLTYEDRTNPRCVRCGSPFTRPRRSGVPETRCPDCWSRPCVECGRNFRRRAGHFEQRFCSQRCAVTMVARDRLPTDLTRSYLAGDWAGVRAALRERAEVGSRGCWVWQGPVRNSYPTCSVNHRSLSAHRVMLEAKLGRPLGKMQAHHTCANIRCINPDHLQPVTAAQNMGEMRQRLVYRRRIAELEAALAAVAPEHPLLAQVSITEGAGQ